MIEETRSLQEIDQIFVAHKERNNNRSVVKKKAIVPYLVKLVQVYYVIDINDTEIRSYATHFFVEAYFLWLALLCKYKLVPSKLIHEKLRPMVATMQEFLLF